MTKQTTIVVIGALRDKFSKPLKQKVGQKNTTPGDEIWIVTVNFVTAHFVCFFHKLSPFGKKSITLSIFTEVIDFEV